MSNYSSVHWSLSGNILFCPSSNQLFCFLLFSLEGEFILKSWHTLEYFIFYPSVNSSPLLQMHDWGFAPSPQGEFFSRFSLKISLKPEWEYCEIRILNIGNLPCGEQLTVMRRQRPTTQYWALMMTSFSGVYFEIIFLIFLIFRVQCLEIGTQWFIARLRVAQNILKVFADIIEKKIN